jgi:hypothetical protein
MIRAERVEAARFPSGVAAPAARPSSSRHGTALNLIRTVQNGSDSMFWSRNTKRPSYSTLRNTGRDIVSQWPLRADARNDVQGLAVEPGGNAAWSEDGLGRDGVTDRQRLDDFLYGR